MCYRTGASSIRETVLSHSTDSPQRNGLANSFLCVSVRECSEYMQSLIKGENENDKSEALFTN